MRLIEGMKELKRLAVKIADLKKKIAQHSADYDHETPVYKDQEGQITEWLQSASDTMKRCLDLRLAIQRTNLQTMVKIELDGKQVEKSIAEWIHRRRDLAKGEQEVWAALTDKGLREGTIQQSSGEKREVKLRRYYDPAKRDKMVALYRDEPSIIDATLEITNATTDIVGIA